VTWVFEPVQIVGTAYGRPVDKDGHFCYAGNVNQATINKASSVLDDLFALLDKHMVVIWEDGEANRVIISLDDNLEVAYNHEREVEIWSHGNLAGTLKRVVK